MPGPELEYVQLASHAEVQNGLLYVNGGGVTDLLRPPSPPGQEPIATFGIVFSVLIPWSDQGRTYILRFRVEDQDGRSVFEGAADGSAEARADTLPGADLRVPLAINVAMPFPAPGAYRLVGDLDGQLKTASFRIREAQPAAQ